MILCILTFGRSQSHRNAEARSSQSKSLSFLRCPSALRVTWLLQAAGRMPAPLWPGHPARSLQTKGYSGDHQCWAKTQQTRMISISSKQASFSSLSAICPTPTAQW